MPGISFGTVAIFLDIYEKIINAINIVDIKKNRVFLAFLVGGVFCGVFMFSSLITYLLYHHEMVTYFSFIGMIIGCAPLIYKRAKIEKVRFLNVAMFCLALSVMIALSFIPGSHANQTLEQLGGITPPLLVWIFVSGFLCAMIMMIPGISGSVILLMLGAYTVSVEAVSTFNVPIIGAVTSGIILGIVAGAKLVKMILGFFPQALYCIVLGLVIGSIFIIFPGFTLDATGGIALLLSIIFAVITYLFSRNN